MADLAVHQDGKLSQNIAHFARALRRAGLPIGPSRVIEAVRAVALAGFHCTSRKAISQVQRVIPTKSIKKGFPKWEAFFICE